MILGFLSDAHGNAVALRRCLEALARLGAGQTYFLGDATGYLPGETAVLHLLAGAGIPCLLGNHDAMITGRLPFSEKNEAAYQHRPALARLGEAGLAQLRQWMERAEFTLPGPQRFLLVHGDPRNPLEGYLYPDTDLTPLAGQPFDIVVCGHTHRPFARQAGNVLVINAGSCGLPRDQGDAPSFATYDTVTRQARIHRVRVSPEETLAGLTPGAPVHASVQACLRRQVAPEALVGEFVGGGQG